MPRTITKTVFQFNELNDKAKEKARDWYKEDGFSYEWWDSTYDDADTIAKILGIDINRKNQKWINISTKKEGIDRSAAIYFSGFSSQGDGACFEGAYSYKEDAPKLVREYAPQDAELHRIADELQELQSQHSNALTAKVKHDGHYYHKYCTGIEVYKADENTFPGDAGSEVTEETEKALGELLRDFMEWIYRRLEAEFDYLNSDESVDDTIQANEYEFNEDGTRSRD